LLLVRIIRLVLQYGIIYDSKNIFSVGPMFVTNKNYKSTGSLLFIAMTSTVNFHSHPQTFEWVKMLAGATMLPEKKSFVRCVPDRHTLPQTPPFGIRGCKMYKTGLGQV
jgi:hypothetical protein